MVVSNSDLSPVEKLHYLKSQVSGEASRFLTNISITADNFPLAWKALTDRYENKRAIVRANLDRVFDLKPLTQATSNDLKHLLSTVKESLGSLSSLGVLVEHWDTFLVHFITRRLDATLIEAWEIQLGESQDLASFAQLETFLEGRIHALEAISVRNSISKSTSSKPNLKAKSGRSLSLLQRANSFHRLSECWCSKRCRVCKSQHHTLLHRDTASGSARSSAAVAVQSAPSSTSPLAAPEDAEKPTSLSHVASSLVEQSDSQILLATAQVRLVVDGNRSIVVRALLDQGSEISLIRESVVQLMQLSRRRSAMQVSGIGSHTIGSVRGVVSVNLQSCVDPSFTFSVTSYILPQLTGKIPSEPIAVSSWDHLEGLPLADPTFQIPSHVDLILGADVYGYLLTDATRKGSANAPVAQNTSLGWIISGFVSSKAGQCPTVASLSMSNDINLQDSLQRFWLQEEVGSLPTSRLTDDELECEAHFRTTHSRDAEGRYIVRLPFRSTAGCLGESRHAAARSFFRVHQQIQRNDDFGRLYREFMAEYASLGHMTLCDSSVELDSVFLPHHGVLRQQSTTTKLRVVFNGSARTTSGHSLNDCLHSGPKLQQDLDVVLLRWRVHSIVFVADIEKMYRQILVHPEDRRYQMILWSESSRPQPYYLCTVTYGLASAPYLALRTLQQLADDEESRFPLAAQIIRDNMYVDDVLAGADNPDLARDKARQITQLLIAGGFRLQKWSTNDPSILSEVHDASQPSVSLDFNSEARTLGLSWHPASDTFSFKVSPFKASSLITKRNILSHIAQLFDPLGWLSPITIVGKILIQQLWKDQLEWDEPVSSSIQHTWMTLVDQLSIIEKFRIPRWLHTYSDSQALELHGFSDASQDALSAVVYVRSISDFPDVHISLLIAKSKVAPIKKQSIPRLELSAAVLLARLIARIQQTLTQYQSAPVHLWVDSSVSLAWIQSQPSRWTEFVANRVSLIQELVPDARWHHVAGTENPADCASRGLLPQQLRDQNLWWRGPDWLRQHSVSWPSITPPINSNVNLEQRRSRCAVATTDPPAKSHWSLLDQHSQLNHLLRITAWILHVVSRLKGSPPSLNPYALSPKELHDAELFWIKEIQRLAFAAEISSVSTGTPLSRSNPLSKLTPFLGQDGVLRAGGRLKHSLLDPDAKHPAILPRDGPFSQLLLSDVHERTCHGGVQLMMSILRRKFWILGGRSPISSFVRRCVKCIRYCAVAAQELMGQLPTSRVTPGRPFMNSGVDYAGPFTLRTWRGRSARQYKGYLILFVCFSTSAVHLELATDYTTQGFLAAYKRFTGRRGICKTITSDCGTNLVGADAELRRLFSSASKDCNDLIHLLASDGTSWNFNPPGAPHFGGKWEAAVKSTKFHLRRIIGDSVLTYEEFVTILTQIEAILNSRPLCALSEDPDDLDVLTPAHFLIGGPLAVLPEPELADVPVSRLTRWQLLRQCVDRFWKRWSSDYLHHLQTRFKWQRPVRSISQGDLVLVMDERVPPSKWLLARVVATHPGADGLVRVVTLRTATSTFKRPIAKLCPILVSESTSTS